VAVILINLAIVLYMLKLRIEARTTRPVVDG
jgi:uncharacterized membrane protein (DUF2068 family)